MNFSSPDKVAQVIENLKDAELKRSPNRGLIDALFNGAPPYTAAEAEENHIQWNVNWGEGTDLLLQGREQLENAHLSTDFAFTVRMPDAPKGKQVQYGQEATRLTNRLLRRSMPYLHTQRSKWGSVILHGTGAQMWEDCYVWRPYFVGIDDLLLPTDTEISFENLNHFAVRRRMTPGQLFRKTFGKPEGKRDPAWKLKTVQKILNQYKDLNQNQNSYNWAEHPEKMAELWKQNAMYYESDAVPVIWLWDFYYQEDDCPQPCWHRKILLDRDCVPGRTDTTEESIVYLYESTKPHADNLGEILHVQFLDGNNVPPFMYHSCRGLGQRLHDAVQALNRLRCQFIQKVFEDMMLLFRAQDPIDRSRLDKIYLGMNYGIIPEGLNFVTRDQRYQLDPKLVEIQLSNLRQLIGEGSQQYTQDVDNGTNKERTAFEVNTMLQQTTRLTGSMLNLSYLQEAYAYEEICRRLTLENSPDFAVKRYQNDLLMAGIPKKWIDSARWEIEPVRVLGSGNQQMEQAQAQAMLNVRPMLNPQAQNEVMHDYVYAVTHDPKRANRLAPLDGQPQVTDTVHDTEIVYGALLGGSQVTPKSGLVPIEVCATMLKSMGFTVAQIMKQDGVGTAEQVRGLINAARYTDSFIKQLSGDKTQAETARNFADSLGQLMNMVKAMAQRQEEAKQAEGQDPEMMQKLQMDAALGQQKLQLTQQAHVQKLTASQQAHQQKLSAADQMHRAEIAAFVETEKVRLAAERAQLEMDRKAFETEQRIKALETAHDIRNKDMAAKADTKRKEAQAKAQAKTKPKAKSE